MPASTRRSRPFSGADFNPSQSRLYLSSQRGGSVGAGINYEISGPFRKVLNCG